MTFLVDANVLSEPTKPSANPLVISWLDRHDAQLATNPIILGELQYGILRLASGKRRTHLLQWFADGVRTLFHYQLDVQTADIWAQLLATLRRRGRIMPVRDSLIAATAIQHDLIVATRNVADYANAGVDVVNPFER